MTDDEAIAAIEEILEREAGCFVMYDDKHHAAGWIAVAVPKTQGTRSTVGARAATGATKREAVESLLAAWQSDVQGAGEPTAGG